MKRAGTMMQFAVVAAVGLATITGSAIADDTANAVSARSRKHQDIMNSGKTTHEDAWAATNEESMSAGKTAQGIAEDHKRIMASGKTTHEDAWDATNRPVSSSEAKRLTSAAKRHQELMNQGKPHEQAWRITDAEQGK